jgi:UDP-N-acetylglucosamine 2-epimerase (non-hydrolysing)
MKSKKKIAFILGTRPEVIKLAPVISHLKKYSSYFKTFIIATAQHRQMLDQTLEIFSLQPNYDLNIMEEDQTLSRVVAKAASQLEKVISQINPDLVLVQGDTTTAFIGGLVGFYHRSKIGHIEAGLRTSQKYFPFPEEINRRLISVVADFHFAPTLQAQKNLLQEGIKKEKIFVTGNTIVDALLSMVKKNYSFQYSLLNRIVPRKKIILVTAHRRENLGMGIKNICQALKKIKAQHPEIVIIYPVHLNPAVRKEVRKYLSGKDGIYLTPPLVYVDLVNLMNCAYLILTDSGGIQEEAPCLGKPVLVLREVTERPEGVRLKLVKVVGTNPEKIITETNKLLEDKEIYAQMSKVISPYGDGKASLRIVEIILVHFKLIKERKIGEWQDGK